jgi:hypothetical protein
MNLDAMTLDQLRAEATKPYGKGQRVDSLNHLDAGEADFFQLQLTYIQRQQLEIKHKPLRAAQFIPVSSEAPPGAESIKIRYFDIVGEAKWVADYASDFPAANTYGSEKTFNIEGLGSSYTYSIQEIRRAQMAGIPLDQRSAMAAERAINEKIDTVAWLGDASVGMYGLLKYPGSTTYTVPATGTGSSTLWSTKTPDQIIADVTGMLTAVHVATNGKERPTTLLLPLVEYNRLAGLRTGPYNDKTVLAYLKENLALIGLREIEWINESVGIGTTGNIPAGQLASNRAVVYVKDPEHLRLELPISFESFAPQLEGMVYKILCYARTAGVIAYYAPAICVADGI